MRLSLFVLWAIVGWCGTFPIRLWLWRWWWWWPIPPIPDPDPPPYYRGLIVGIVGAVGGLIGGWAFTTTFGSSVMWSGDKPYPEPWIQLVATAATTVGAFLGASLLAELYGLATGRGRAQRG